MTQAAIESGVGVWDRIWRDAPDAAKDHAQLDRERNSQRWQRFAARLRANHGDIRNLATIELGAGRGDVSVLLAQQGAKVTLVDCSDVALQRAGERFEQLGLPARFIKADLFGDLSALAHRFDAALSVGVVEHFRGDQRTRAIAAHAAVLRSGGTAMISVPNAWCAPYRAWKAYLELRKWWPYGFEFPYSRRELRNRASDAGLISRELFAEGWLRSICDHWGRGIFHRQWSGGARSSWLDRWGYDLILLADRNDP